MSGFKTNGNSGNRQPVNGDAMAVSLVATRKRWGTPKPLSRRGKRDDIAALTGQADVPVLVLDDAGPCHLAPALFGIPRAPCADELPVWKNSVSPRRNSSVCGGAPVQTRQRRAQLSIQDFLCLPLRLTNTPHFQAGRAVCERNDIRLQGVWVPARLCTPVRRYSELRFIAVDVHGPRQLARHVGAKPGR
jgi:hypothetical protein